MILDLIFNKQVISRDSKNEDSKERIVYLTRWFLIPHNNYFNIYLHRFTSSDEDSALHDHPWSSLSIILNRCYLEHVPKDLELFKKGISREEIIIKRYPFWPIYRNAEYIHRIELINEDKIIKPVWTLFITGHWVRNWGFWCPKGWRDSTEFLDETGQNVGLGCN